MTDTNKTAVGTPITVTSSAVAEVQRLLAKEKEDNLYLRLAVAAGGCSGMSYSMEFDTEKKEFDREFDFEGLKVLVDLQALRHLSGTTLDFKGGLLGGGFSFDNPNAKRSCGCGSSFSC
ncbi:MAG: iron-sulfur cluster assembly accessory protein [bacterium]|nr:iron-sulfur cluster assembly accessory protein [bacterium]